MGLMKGKDDVEKTGLQTVKIIRMAGVGFEDILLYLLAVIKALDKKILIIDWMREHIFYSVIPHVEGIDPSICALDINTAHYFMVGEQADIDSLPVEQNDYDFLIELYDVSDLKSRDVFTVIITDEHRKNAELLEKADVGRTDIFIIRSFTGVIKKQFDNIIYRLGTEEIYAIPFSMQDQRYGILAEYENRYRFSGISGRLETVIMGILKKMFPEIKEKEIQKAFRVGKRGGRK